MKRHYIEGDGNCSFPAVAFSLLTHSPLISQHSPQFFSNLGIDRSNDLKSVGMKLRNLTVAEWKCNQQDYERFFPDVDIQEEAIKFMRSGYFFFGKLAEPSFWLCLIHLDCLSLFSLHQSTNWSSPLLQDI